MQSYCVIILLQVCHLFGFGQNDGMPKRKTLKGKEMYTIAEGIARGAHAGQTRRDGKTPYFKHVLEVASRLKGWDLKTIGILHDTLEDTKLKEADLVDAGFPPRIIAAVKAMTKPEMEYFTYIEMQILGNPDARQVKLADLACNIRGNDKPEQKAKYLKAQKLIKQAAKTKLTVRTNDTDVRRFPDAGDV
jgi:(p)ppGpp synthase/HD superfamily hydrolase